MAQQADGAVYIDTLLNTTGFKAGGKEIEAAVRRMAKTVQNIGDTTKASLNKQVEVFVKQNQTLAQQEQKIASLEKKREELANQKIETEDFKNLSKDLNSTEKKIDSLYGKLRELEKDGKEGSDPYQRTLNQLDIYQEKVNDIRRSMEELKASGSAYQTPDTSAIDEKIIAETQKLQQMNNSLNASYSVLIAKVKKYGGDVARVMNEGAQATEEQRQYIGILQSTLNGLKMAAHAPVSMIKGLGRAIKSLPHKTLDLVKNGISKISSAAKSAAKNIGGFLLSGLKKAGAAMLGLHKNTKKSNGSLGSSFKAMLKYGLGIRSVFVLVNKLRGALVDGFKNLAQYNGRTNTSISSLMSALTQLKNSFATAFAPILNVVAPILTTFINMISRAVTYVGMLIAALTGQGTFVKAIGVQQDYAESLENSAGAAKDAEKSTSDYLSGLDEVRKFDEPDKGSSSGSGGGGGVGTQDMFEEVPIESRLKNLADKIKNLIKSEDWEGLGSFVADGLNRGMEKIKQAISWDNVGPSVTHFVDAFSGTFNSLVNNFDWNLLGQTVGNGINTIVNTINLLADSINWQNIGVSIASGLNSLLDTINPQNLGKVLSQKIRIAIEAAYGFVTTFDWSGFGLWIGQVINGFFNNIDFKMIAQTLSAGIIGAFNFITEAIATVDWYGLGQKVKEFLVNIDWAGIFNSVFEAIGSALGGLAEFLWGLIEDAWNSVVEWWHDTAYEDGKFSIKGLKEGILNALKNVGKWIKEHIFNPFINGFKKVFGINSPSTVMAEQGNFIILGLLNGLKNQFVSVLSWLGELPSKFKQFFQTAKNKITEVFNNIGSWFSEKFSSAWTGIKNAFSSTKSFFQGVWDGITSIFGNIAEWFKSKFSASWTAVKNVFSSGGQVFSGIKEGILNSLKSVINSLISGINRVVAVPFNGLNSSLKKLRELHIPLIGSPFSWLPNINVPQIPYLATGAVIPPNAPFMAVLGDQKRGNNIETPEALLRRIIREETGGQGAGNSTYTFIGQINRRTLFEEMMTEAQLVRGRTGKNPFEMA